MSSKPRILIVDDEKVIRVLLTRLLGEDEYLVSCASSGKQALEIMRRVTFDLVITDLIMPGDLTGIDVIQAAKRKDPSCGAILMTGRTSPDAEASAIESGAVYIRKPFDADLMKAVVKEVLATRGL